MINLKKNKKSLGFTVIEILIACSIISISMFALMQTAQKGIRLSNQALEKSQASLLLEEGAEAIKSIRDNSWASIVDGTYHLYFNTNTKVWVLNTNSTSLASHIPTYPIDSVFDRTVTIASVGRDANDDILASGGTSDAGTKKVTVTVSWTQSGTSTSQSLVFYIADIFS